MIGRKKAKKKMDYHTVEELYDPKLRDFENAENIGIPVAEFTHWRVSRGFSQCKRKTVNIDTDEFYKLYDEGRSDREIARKLNTNSQSVFLFRHKLGLASNHRCPSKRSKHASIRG